MVWRTAEPSLASELREQRGAFVTTLRRLVAMHEAQEAATVDEEEAAARSGRRSSTRRSRRSCRC